MQSIREQKAALREKMEAQAAAFDKTYLRQSDEAILAALLAQRETAAADIVFCYISVGNEPDTHAFVEKMFAAGKTVCVPRCLKGGIMQARRITSFDQLRPAPFGLLEPGEDAPLVDEGQIGLVVAPCVTTDERCGRLGHGAGYYDRFLAKISCPVLCLCRGRLVQSRVPMDEYDRFVDAVITENGVRWRNS